MVSNAEQFQALARWNLRILRGRFVDLARGSRLMAFTLLAFLAGYLVIGFFLFSRGLRYIDRLPAVGGLLGERILYLLFFFIFVMLILSNVAVQFGSLFTNRETRWLVTLPLSPSVLFFWKTLESLAVSSWGFMFLSAPLLAAYGTLHGANWQFYTLALLLLFPFVAIPAAVASWILLLLARYAKKSWLTGAGVIVLAALGFYFWRQYGEVAEAEATGGNIVFALNRALRHTQISTHALVPSTWWTDALIQQVKGLPGSAVFNGLLLLSNALMALLLTFVLAGPAFPSAWHRLASGGARRKTSHRVHGEVDEMRKRSRIASWFPGGPVTRALVHKDIREFIREPSQWIQAAVIFGFLFLYVLNLRNMGYDYESPFWVAVVTFLNMTVCSLALSTLTTRFVFPQISLEGQRLWIVALAPFSLRRVFLQKLLMNLFFTGGASMVLMLVSGIMLELSPAKIVYFTVAIGLMSFGLNAIAMSFGALFPNLEETNPAKIVSGFGGTLCLILSFLYVALFIAILAALSAGEWLPGNAAAGPEPAGQGPGAAFRWGLAGLGALGLTLGLAGVPLIIAINRVKKLELLGKL